MQSLSNRDEIGNNFYDDNKTLCVDVNGVLLIAMGLPGSNQNVFLRTEHLRETRMVYPNPRCWESKTLQLTQPRALEPVLKMQTSFAPFLCPRLYWSAVHESIWKTECRTPVSGFHSQGPSWAMVGRWALMLEISVKASGNPAALARDEPVCTAFPRKNDSAAANIY